MTQELNFDESKNPDIDKTIPEENTKPEENKPDPGTQIESITYFSQYYSWYCNMKNGDAIKIPNEEIAKVISDFVSSNTENVVCVLTDSADGIKFKVQDIVLIDKIKELEKKIQENKNRIEEIGIKENEIRFNATRNMDNRELDKIIPLNRERTILMDDNDVLLQKIMELKRAK